MRLQRRSLHQIWKETHLERPDARKEQTSQEMEMPEEPSTTPRKTAVFDIHAISGRFPESADTMLIDTRLTDEPEASSRVFRVYTPVPAHYHATCDEYLLVISGRAMFFLGDIPPFEVSPGRLMFFKKGTIHGAPRILEEPFVVLSVDTPRRDPKDVIFVNPQDGSPETFIQSRILY